MKITELAQQTSKEFAKVWREFDRVHEKFAEVDLRFDAIDKKFDAIDKKFEEVDRKFDEVDRRFDEVDKKFIILEMKMDDMREDILERMDTRFAALYEFLDSHTKRMDAALEEIALTNRQLKRHDRWIHELAERTDHKLV